MNISKYDYAKAVEAYLASFINVYKKYEHYEWEIIDDLGISTDDNDRRRHYDTPTAALNAGIAYLKTYKPDAVAIANNDAREWMRYNNHTLA